MKQRPVSLMRSRIYVVLLACALVLAWSLAAQALTYSPVALGTYNYNLQGIDGGFPSGSQTYFGVPFSIPTTPPNIWHAVSAVGPNPRIIDIPVNIAAVAEVDTLINTFWGTPGTPGDPSTSYAYLDFYGSLGAHYTYYLYGNYDIRDYNQNVYTNSINGTTTRNVVLLGGHRLDMQTIALPPEFATQTLDDITLSDIGADGFQRAFISGLSVGAAAIPLPSTLLLLGSGLAALTGLRGRLRQK